jgi:hypothetical protein
VVKQCIKARHIKKLGMIGAPPPTAGVWPLMLAKSGGDNAAVLVIDQRSEARKVFPKQVNFSMR